MKKYLLVSVVDPVVPSAVPETFVTENPDDISAYVNAHPELLINIKSVDTLPL